jgi:hypothetical protein
MLDVHPPHATAHSCKDFFVHIATISVGLLIAIGLEQTVEWLHHRHQLREAREQLAMELQDNRAILERDLNQTQKAESELERDMVILRKHQVSQSPITEKLDYSWLFYRFPDAAWQAAKQNGSLNLMPYNELKANAFLYTVCTNTMEAATTFSTAIEVAGALAKSEPGGDLSPHDTEQLIAATSEARGRLAFTSFLLQVTAQRIRQVGPIL